MAALIVCTANNTDDNSSGMAEPTAFNTFFNSPHAMSRASSEFYIKE